MTAHILKGSKREIAEKLASLEGEVREVIALVDDEPDANQLLIGEDEDIFAEMDPHTVRADRVDDSRAAIYDANPGA